MVSWVIDGGQRLVAPLEPAYFRALTDNDIDFLNFVPPLIKFHPLYGWRRAQRRTHALRTVVQAGADNTVEVHIAMSTPRLREDLITYKIYPNGRLYVYHSAVPKQDMLRFGFQMTLPGSYEYVTGTAEGRHPSYRDRKNRGRALGRDQSTVTALEHRYMRPQESSNRTDTYDLYLCDSHGEGFRVQAYYETPFAFSAYHYTTTGLDKAAHIHEIPYDPSLTTLNIDGVQCGVGGDLPGQGAVRAPYRVTAGEKCSYAFVLEPMHKRNETRVCPFGIFGGGHAADFKLLFRHLCVRCVRRGVGSALFGAFRTAIAPRGERVAVPGWSGGGLCDLYCRCSRCLSATAKVSRPNGAGAVLCDRCAPGCGENYYTVKTTAIDLPGVPQNIRSTFSAHADLGDVPDGIYTGKVTFASTGENGYAAWGKFSDGEFLSGKASPVRKTNQSAPGSAVALIQMRHAISSRFAAVLPGDRGALATALITGSKTNLSVGAVSHFRTCGATHLMAVSGLHLSVIVGSLYWLLRKLRLPAWLTTVLTGAVLLVYDGVAGFSASVVRASLMMAVLLAARLFGRKADGLNSLGLAVFLLCTDPFAVTDVSLQLSVTSVLSLLTLSPVLNKSLARCIFLNFSAKA